LTIFTMVIHADKSYSFQLFEQLDHANGSNPNDVINLVFGVTADPQIGNSVDGNITVSVRDDAPDARDDNGGTTSGTNPTRSGNVLTNHVVGQDTPGAVTHIEQVNFGGNFVNLPANGNNVTINGTYGTLTINNTGAWSYTANNQANGTDS